MFTHGFFAWTRNPNYFGEIAIYCSFALLCQNNIVWAIIITLQGIMFPLRMLQKDYSLSKKEGWDEYGQVSWKGEVTYSTSDGGVVVDRSGHVQCLKTTAKSSQLALELATMRFSGQVLIVEGQESFQKEVARLAKLRGIEVRFTKPAIKRTKTKGQEAEL